MRAPSSTRSATPTRFKTDLGLKSLVEDWKGFLSPKYFREDLIAGVTVSCIAIPLSLAIALASGVPPAVGLVTAIIAGVVCALFGGTPLAVSGPAAAMAILIADVVQKYGVSGLLFVGFVCGVLQILSGITGLGRLIRLVPVPVIAGFTAGIGAIIFIGQLPRALGLPPPDQSHVIDVITHISELIGQARPAALGLTLSTLFITFFLPKLYTKLPAPLIAVMATSIIAIGFDLNVEKIGQIPSSLPLPRLPTFPQVNWLDLASASFIVYALASLETLLSSSAVDKLSRTAKRHDSDQEMIGQGFGNIASSLFGGIPVTGVIARSALNVQAGAKTRRSSIIHSLTLLATVYLFAPWMSKIPISVLAGVLFSVALRMMHTRELVQLWRTSKAEALTYGITFFTIIFFDLIMGVQAGLLAALVIAAIQFGRNHSQFQVYQSNQGPTRVLFNGPLTFLSSNRTDAIRSQLESISPSHGVVIDMSEVSTIDASAATQLIELIEQLSTKKIKVVLLGLTPACRSILKSQDHSNILTPLMASTEFEANQLLGADATLSENRLAYGVQKFQHSQIKRYAPLFKNLEKTQNPHTLFITCSDSRINPNLITSTDPGELFIVRNVGNIIPPFYNDSTPAEGAALEFAIGILGVKEIIICGHSECGAMKTLTADQALSQEQTIRYPSLARWLKTADSLKAKLPKNPTAQEAAKRNALIQLENLQTYAIVREKLAKNEIKLHAWYYDIGESRLEEWSAQKGKFIDLTEALAIRTA
jgi:carbonic anhydrase